MNKSVLNILLIEDESLLALEFSNYMEACGYRVVDYVTNAKDAIKVMQENSINLIIMDINIGEKIDGIELYTLLKTDALVIYLTAYKDSETIARAIQTEPLGYLTKPINDSEFRAMLQLAQLKLSKLSKENSQMKELANGYSFDMKSEMLYKQGSFVKLGVKKRQLLKLLIEAHGQAISFQSIEDEIYKDSLPSESAIRTLIYRLRSELDEDMIENELNFGIKLKRDSSPDTCGT